jgi:nucleoside-diphosphate-sugar epimerase
VQALRDRDRPVVGVDRRPGGDHVADLADLDLAVRDLGDPASDDVGDLCDPASGEVGDLLREADAVVHLAGASGVRRTGPDAERAWWRDNVRATDAVLAAVRPSTPLVVASSSSVYGGSGGAPSRESDALSPRGGYARSKAAMEQRCHRRLAAGGHVAIARLFTVAGERQRPDMALARWIDAAVRSAPLDVFGSLERRRDLTDVRDAVDALLGLAHREVTGPVNVGTGTSHSLAELVAAVEAAVGPVRVRVTGAHPDEVEATLADTTRCREVLGFVPHTDLHDLVARQVKARLEQEHCP